MLIVPPALSSFLGNALLEAKLMNKITRLWNAAMLLAVMAIPLSPAKAGTLGCETTVSSVSVNPGGQLTVGLNGFGFAYMCNIVSPMPTSIGPIPTDVCKTWVAQFMTAQAQGKKFSFNVDYGAAATPASCAAITGWNWAVPSPFPYWVNFPTN
jgi:hypothetical protein